MDEKQFNITDAITLLERTPSTLAALLNGLPDIWIGGMKARARGPRTMSSGT